MRERGGVRERRVVWRAAWRGSERGLRASGTGGRASENGRSSRCSGSRLGLSALVLTLAVVLAPPHAGAQTVHGRLLEQGTARPIAAGDLTLLGEDGEAVDRAETDSAGHFTLRSPDPGSFYVRAERIGYRPKTDGILELGEGGEITVDFYLMPQPVELEGVEGTVEGMTLLERKDREYLDWQGFYDRKKMGFGHFITPEEIEEDPPIDYYDLFRKMPGVRGVSGARGGEGVQITARGGTFGGGGYCSPAIFVDGIPTSNPPPVEAIVGVEVYKGIASVPLQFSRLGGGCGVVLVWTRG